eukprot:4200273-Heterocapsa_arctica.AAC.1
MVAANAGNLPSASMTRATTPPKCCVEGGPYGLMLLFASKKVSASTMTGRLAVSVSGISTGCPWAS